MHAVYDMYFDMHVCVMFCCGGGMVLRYFGDKWWVLSMYVSSLMNEKMLNISFCMCDNENKHIYVYDIWQKEEEIAWNISECAWNIVSSLWKALWR